MPHRFIFALALLVACAGTARQTSRVAAAATMNRSQAPLNGPPPVLRLPEQHHFRLSNGLAVRLVEYRRLPIIALELIIGAGAARDPQSLPGLASFTADMVTEGTKRRTATQISDDLGYIGGHLEAYAGLDTARVTGSSLSRHLGSLLEILGDVVTHPTFPEADFARVQNQRWVALVQQREEPSAVAAKTFTPLFWSGHPYGHSPEGTEISVKATRREDLVRFHAETWQPGNAELVVVGDVSEADLRPMLERELSRWAVGKHPAPLVPGATAHRQQTVLVEKSSTSQTYLLLGMPGLERSHSDYFAAEVAFQILGGGGSSRLYRSLRQKHGYTYGMWAFLESRRLGGRSVITGSVKADLTGAALKVLFNEIRALRDVPVSSEELADAKGSLVLSLPSDFVTAAGIAAKLAEEVAFELPDDYWNRYASEVAKVTVADVQQAAQRYLDPSRLTTVMVGDWGVVKPQLQGLSLGRVERGK